MCLTAASSLVGFFPLVIASGAGSASRWSLGTALFGGLLVATILSLLVVPVLYIVIKGLAEQFLDSGSRPKPPSEPPPSESSPSEQSRSESSTVLEEPALSSSSHFSGEVESPASE